MPRLALLLAAVIVLAVPAASSPMPYPSGRITYKIVAATMKGSSTVVWADGGKKFRQDMTGVSSSDKSKRSAFKISDGRYLFSHESMIGKRVYRRKLPPEMVGQVPFLSMPKADAKKRGKATLLGKPCDIVEVEGKTLWVWKGLPLKMEQGGGKDAMLIEATKVELSIKVPPSTFQVPRGMDVKDAPQALPKAKGAAPEPKRR